MLKRKIVFLFFCFVFLSNICEAQRFLALDKNGRVKRVRFYQHDMVKVKVQGSRKWHAGEIDFIGDSVVSIKDRIINLREIKAIRIKSDRYFENYYKAATYYLPAAGGMLLAIAPVNSAINATWPAYSPGLLITAGALIACGPLAHRLSYHQYRLT